MNTKIFVNLPVKNLDRSMAFFAALGYTFNPQFTDDNAASMVVSDDIYVMLLVEPYFQTFTPKPVGDATRSTEVIVSLSVEKREDVDRIVEQAVAAGAKTPKALQDHGFMVQHGFEDLDGHLWEYVYMDPSFVQ